MWNDLDEFYQNENLIEFIRKFISIGLTFRLACNLCSINDNLHYQRVILLVNWKTNMSNVVQLSRLPKYSFYIQHIFRGLKINDVK